MEIIPAIDIKGGKCVRLTQGKFDQQNLYSNDPVKIAKRWQDEGARRLHIVDLDAARVGMPQNQQIVRDIMRRTGLPVQLGGGIRSGELAQRMINIGVDRVILGTAAATDPLIGEIFRSLGEKAILGLDATNGMVAIQGWAQATSLPAVDFARTMVEKGARRIIFTDIARDGMLNGPNLAAIQEIQRAVSVPIIASGGVSSLKDIQDIKALGVEGVILGKSLYEGTVFLPDAIKLAAS
ncbi:MAG TPA: 1-(5-phosphoribosyl)-5-[(5-phosphoribosylamino)methylideneamino]imidazole-4-carboxamide isomerase [Capsulimonadaceae bacterium]|nr:1-(5-phosphoribosyl)-5-[(5-phosphoribosylamino)methylideneamino]imidazole-4-carboxamide isomerase [Capsulimonadaceae bacterium]